MHPYLFHVPLPGGRSFPIASYGSMILVGFLVCLYLLRRRGERTGLDPMALFDAAVLGLLGGIVGARLLHVVQHWEGFVEEPLRIFGRFGFSYFGGLMGGTVGLLVGVGIKKLPLRHTLDLGAGLVPLGHAFGRVGCFLNGCCYGKVTEAWVGVRFPKVVSEVGGEEHLGSPVFRSHLVRGLVTRADQWSLPVHPTQLYAVAYNLVIFGILSYLLPRRWRPGQIAWLYLILYGTARYWNEFLRADTAPVEALGGLTSWQAIALAGAVFGTVMFADTMRRPAVPLPEPWEGSD
ncbi:MAG: prolipoprotein diacylglyceryl transferase [Candidatus Brocadiia bacterium]